MTLRRLVPAAAVVAAGMLVTVACGGTLEGPYRRGELPTSTTGGGRTTGTTPTTVVTTTTATTTPTRGNAAGQRAQGEPEGDDSGGTIVGSATRRTAVPPLGGRHR